MKAEIYTSSGIMIREIEATKLLAADPIIGVNFTQVVNDNQVVAFIPIDFAVVLVGDKQESQ